MLRRFWEWMCGLHGELPAPMPADQLEFVTRDASLSFRISPPGPGDDLADVAVASAHCGPVIDLAREAAAAGLVARGEYYLVEARGPLAKTADGSGYRALVHRDGKIHSHARLKKVPLSRGPALLSFAWGALTIIVGQKLLADVSAALVQIDGRLQEIADFQQQDRIATIRGYLKYLRQIFEARGRGGAVSAAVDTKLEDAEQQLGGIQEHLDADLAAVAEKYRNVRAGSVLGTEKLYGELEKHEVRLQVLEALWIQCMATRCLASGLLPDGDLKDVRTASLKREIEAFAGLGPRGSLDQKLDEVRGAFPHRNFTVFKTLTAVVAGPFTLFATRRLHRSRVQQHNERADSLESRRDTHALQLTRTCSDLVARLDGTSDVSFLIRIPSDG